MYSVKWIDGGSSKPLLKSRMKEPVLQVVLKEIKGVSADAADEINCRDEDNKLHRYKVRSIIYFRRSCCCKYDEKKQSYAKS
jgi:hypothetical protein